MDIGSPLAWLMTGKGKMGGTSCTLIMKVESIDTVSLCTQYYAGELVITFLS